MVHFSINLLPERSLDQEADGQPAVLQGVGVEPGLSRVGGGVDVRAGARHGIGANVCRRVAGSTSGGVVGASVSATVGDDRKRGVDGHQALHVGSEAGVNKVLVDGNDVVVGIASHVLVDNSEDIDVVRSIVVENVTGAKQTTLLTAVEVELEGVARGVLGNGHDAEGLKDGGNAGSVVVSTRGPAGHTLRVDAVVVSAHHDPVCGGTRNRSNDTGLVERVRELSDRDGSVGRGGRPDSVQHVGCAGRRVGAPVVSVEDVGETSDGALDVALHQPGDDGIRCRLFTGSRVRRLTLGQSTTAEGSELFEFLSLGDVHEVDVLEHVVLNLLLLGNPGSDILLRCLQKAETVELVLIQLFRLERVGIAKLVLLRGTTGLRGLQQEGADGEQSRGSNHDCDDTSKPMGCK